jgi:hypothetical protein
MGGWRWSRGVQDGTLWKSNRTVSGLCYPQVYPGIDQVVRMVITGKREGNVWSVLKSVSVGCLSDQAVRFGGGSLG